jgi:hypothetical protein
LIRTPLIRSAPRCSLARPFGRRAGLLATAAALAAAAACGGADPFAPNPANNVDTEQSDLVVYPLRAATGPLGSAVNLLALAVVRPGLTSAVAGAATIPAPNFDFAVDRAADGRVRLLPSRLVVDLTGVGQAYRTAFQTSTAPYDSIAEAPANGYQADTLAATVGVNESVIVEAQSGACNAFYAKVVVVAIDAASGAVTLRARINPNCGFRSLRPGRG